jgi:hypothetical protein
LFRWIGFNGSTDSQQFFIKPKKGVKYGGEEDFDDRDRGARSCNITIWENRFERNDCGLWVGLFRM